TEPTAIRQSPPPMTPRKSSRWGWIVGGLVVLVALIFAIVVLSGRNSHPSGARPEQSNLAHQRPLPDSATSSASRSQRTLTGHSKDVNSVTFSPDGKVLASGSSDGTAQFWEARTGERLRKFE